MITQPRTPEDLALALLFVGLFGGALLALVTL